MLVTIAYAIRAEAYVAQWKTWKHFDEASLALALGAVALFSLGAMLAPRSRCAAWPKDNPAVLRRVFWIAAGLSVFGYLAWFGVAFLRGLRPYHIISLATGQNALNDDVKEIYMGTVSGITTFTQLGMAAVVLACLCASVSGWKGLRWPLAMLFTLAILRSLLNSERLAVIELAVPGVLAAAALWRPASPHWRRAVFIAPVVGVMGLFTFFTGSEYLRSWKGFYAQQQDSLLEFSAIRLSGYYVTALNNGACLARLTPDGYEKPYFTLGFAWKLPVVKAGVRDLAAAPAVDTMEGYSYVMGGLTNLEFNNPSGLFLPMIDFGPLPGLAYWLAAGLFCGWLHGLYRNGHIAGLCLYPMVAVGLLEAGRVLYWSEPRAFPSLVWLAVAAIVMTRLGRRNASRAIWAGLHTTERSPA